jgi:uncharacterized protein (DUF697 family)
VTEELQQRDQPGAAGRGHWLLELIRRSFKKSWEMVSAEYFQEAYSTKDQDRIADRLIAVFSRNASILGGITGLLMSADVIVAFLTRGEGVVELPVSIVIAVFVLCMETVVLIRFQLALVACLGKLYGAPLDPNDPEDVLTILAYALGGSTASAAGTAGMKVGGKLAARIAKTVVQKEVAATFRNVAEKVGLRIIQLALIKYAVPILSIGIGMGANYFATRTIGRIAKNHLREERAEHSSGPAK